LCWRFLGVQKRDTKALQLMLDELIRVNTAARNSLMSLEEKSESEVEEIKSAFVELASTGDWSDEDTASSRRSGPADAEPQNPPKPRGPSRRAEFPANANYGLPTVELGA
jgi:Low affinity iron permease